ncbi:TadE family protein [Vibrio sp. ABG19]|uniref:TadE/TadG family type IV pilus assembly protein n=1 Tax=Vibrio sp. ABG19 TaxID=2817385 RepID=UPI00249E12B9|nr:TadE family protein [Vibrio sp. ABG19]WGY46146.1 pilus assembly protein [Vibrio sp. ABG19]
MTRKLNNQHGLTVIEFTIVATVLLIILFAIFEIAVFVYSLQTLNDISRRSARIATVCVVNDSEIKTLVFSEWTPKDFTADNIEINYLDEDGDVIVDPVAGHINIRYVRARVINYDYGFSGALGFLSDNGVITVPDFQTTLPAESLGVLRVDDPDAKTDC